MTLPPRPPQLNNKPGYNGGLYEPAPGTPKKPQPKKRFSWVLVLTLIPVLTVIGVRGYQAYDRYQATEPYGIQHEDTEAVLTLDHDVRRTSYAIKNALDINPNKNPTLVTPIQTGNNSIVITGDAKEWQVKGRDSKLGDKEKDYIQYTVSTNQQRINGYYRHFFQIIDQNCGCTTSDDTVRGNQLSAAELSQLNTMSSKIQSITNDIYTSLDKDPSYKIASIKYKTPEGMSISVVVVNQSRWAVIGVLDQTEFKEQDFMRYESWNDNLYTYGAYQVAN